MKFSRLFSFFLAVTMLCSNIGLAFNVHYCMGEIASVSTVYTSGEACKMVIEPEKKACCAESKSHKKCCDNKVVDLQDDGDQLVFKTFSIDLAAQFNAGIFSVSVFSPDTSLVETPRGYHFDSHAPPLFKLYHQYIFYA